jgi:hypothetical protein
MDIKDKIKSFEDALLSEDNILLSSIVKEAIEIIKYLKDENDSLWTMIDEQKASDIENHKSLVRQELDRKINETLMLASSKIVKA